MFISGLTDRVLDIMDRDFIQLNGDETIGFALDKMLNFNRDEIVISSKDGAINGVFTRSDLSRLKRYKPEAFKEPVINYAVKNVITIEKDKSAGFARDLMIKKGIGCLPVVEDGRIIGVVSKNSIRDIFYMRIDEMLKLQNNILDNMHEAICISDDKGIVSYWNKSAEKLYGISTDKVIGRHVGEVFPNAMIMRVLKDGKPIENMQHEPVEGKSVILSTIPIYNSENKIVAVVSTDRDITEEVKLSTQLEDARKRVKILQDTYQREFVLQHSFDNITGKSKGMIESINLAQKVAPTSASVLLTGESGTGKDVFARAIHNASQRKGDLIAVNCSAIPYQLLESELFGYVEGAFTGASKGGRTGKFELANNGTLFLDEIGDMPMEMQAKLLRVLQDGVIYRLGSEKPVSTNARIIAATNRDLKKLIKEKSFREDLFYRLAVVQIDLPPLRDRSEDIKDLITLFINQVSKKERINIKNVDPGIYSILSSYKWEGNVRELKNVVQRMVVLSNNGEITIEDMPEYILKEGSNIQRKLDYGMDLEKAIESVEREMIREALKRSKGNKQEAAKILNVKRSTLYYKLDKYGEE